MSKKKIKKIDEFLYNDSKFEIRISTDILSDEKIKEISDYENKMTSLTLDNYDKVKTSDYIDIDFYREIMLDLRKDGDCSLSDDELDQNCMEIYNEPFFIKKDVDNNE